MEFNNAVFYPNWRLRENKTPASLKVEYITHLFYAFARLEQDGTVALSDIHTDVDADVDGSRGCLRACTALKKRNESLKVILSIGGPSEATREAFSLVAIDSQKRQRCASSARALVKSFDLDGIDVDWERPQTGQDAAGYVELLAELRRALPSPNYILTSALTPGEGARATIDLGRASISVDFFNVICYDFSGPDDPVSGHQSQLDRPVTGAEGQSQMTCLSAINPLLMKHRIPNRKIMLGIPVYGRSFLGAKRPGDSFSGAGGTDGVFQYYELPRPHSIREYDHNACAVYCCGEDGGFISYDDPTSVNVKATLVQKHGLRGLFFWEGTGDHSDYRSSLIVAGYRGLSSDP